MELLFSIPSLKDIQTTCVKIDKKQSLKDGTLGKYSDADCKTCDDKICVGHVGYIQLEEDKYIPHPVYHQLIIKVLECICKNCKEIIKTKVDVTSFSNYHTFIKTKQAIYCSDKCVTTLSECKYSVPYNKDKGKFMFTKNVNKFSISIDKEKYSFSEIKELLSNIDPKEMYFDGTFNLSNLILDYVTVLPSTIRNGLCIDGDSDPYTAKYESIMNTKNCHSVLDNFMSLIGYTAEPDGTSMIRHMLVSKSGLMRASLMCSRQNESARSVITTDSTIPLSHVGVPESFKSKLPINVYLIDEDLSNVVDIIKSTEFVSMGNIPIQGAKMMNKKKLLSLLQNYNSPEFYIKRCLDENDWVFINRQPTLHRHSILAFQVRLVPQKTITLNLACVTAFNADFDGDEITLYVASDKGSIEECETILSVEHNIISPEDGSLVIVPVQDCITGVYNMTSSDKEMPEKLIDRLDTYTGIRAITPNEAFANLCGDIKYQRPVDKSELKNIIKSIIKEISPNAAITFMTNLQLMIDDYLKIYPISVSYSDFNPFTNNQIDDILSNYYYKEVPTLDKAENAKDELSFYSEQIETQICMYLDTTIKESILVHITQMVQDSDLLRIINSGAKGKSLDLVQSWVALCQQYVFGRQKEMYGIKDDATITERKGFVTTSYGRGLDKAGLYYQATAARSTIINTGVNTADPGYLQRQLSKFMSDVVTDDDCNVINHKGVIIYSESSSRT